MAYTIKWVSGMHLLVGMVRRSDGKRASNLSKLAEESKPELLHWNSCSTGLYDIADPRRTCYVQEGCKFHCVGQNFDHCCIDDN